MISLAGSGEFGLGGSLAAFRALRTVPELARNVDGVDAGLFPPGGFIAHAMHQPMMDAAERDREFVACLAAQGARLHVAKMMRVRGFAAAEQARCWATPPHVQARAAVDLGNRENTKRATIRVGPSRWP